MDWKGFDLQNRENGIIEFILLRDGKEYLFRFKFNYPKEERFRKQVYRALFYYLKARFTSVEFGIRTVEQEFLQEIVLKLPDGSDSTVSELVSDKLPQIKHTDLLPF